MIRVPSSNFTEQSHTVAEIHKDQIMKRSFKAIVSCGYIIHATSYLQNPYGDLT